MVALVRVGVALLALVGAQQVRAQTVEEFYRGKSLTIIVSSGPGGGYDTYSRTLARFLGAHIPGKPNIVAQNMPGADGITAINYVYNQAARDGSVMSDTYSTMPFYMLLDGRNARYDPQKVNWLGSSSRAVSVCIAWSASSFKTLDDAMERKMLLSGTGVSGWRVVLPRLYNAIAGSKFEVITGYNTPNDYLAIERGEVDGSCTTYDTLRATQSGWIENQKIRFLAQFGAKPVPGLDGVPNGRERIKTDEDRKAMDLILLQQETGRPYLFPPGVPADRVAAIRAAFDETMKDPGFLAAAKQGGLLIDPMPAAEMETFIANGYASSAATVERAKTLLHTANAH